MTATAVRPLPCLPADRDLPGAFDLLAGPGLDRVARFLAGRGLEPHRVEPAQAHYRPGRWLTVCFRTAAVDRSSGYPVCLTVTVECRPDEAPAVWAFPDDPALPGLPAAADGRLVHRRLRPRPADVAIEPLRYRPRRRAVLRYRLRLEGSAGADRYVVVKVLPPGRDRRLLGVADVIRAGADTTDRAEPRLRLALPAGRLGTGVLVLPYLRGRALRDLFLAGGPLPEPGLLAALPEALPQRCLPVVGSGRLVALAEAGRRG